jgi:hypothetical protein
MKMYPYQQRAARWLMEQQDVYYTLPVVNPSVIHTPREIAVGPPTAAMGKATNGNLQIQPRRTAQTDSTAESQAS